MDKTTKALIIACFILVGALGFTIGALVQIQEKIPGLHIPHNIKNSVNNTTGTTNKEDNTTSPSKGEWDPSYCPYCGAPFAYYYYEPYWIDSNGILHKRTHRVYKCGHEIIGEELTDLKGMDPEAVEMWRQDVRERGGTVEY
ncbi:hypothetical protein H5T57_02575 [Candidatus Bipolaricaulota bacterium]|nr:hypothetical protein [Candidatus Bipolaricaulota bacterium]